MKKPHSHHRKFPAGDKSAFVMGIVLTLLALLFFAWKMTERLTEEVYEKPTVVRGMSEPPRVTEAEIIKRSR